MDFIIVLIVIFAIGGAINKAKKQMQQQMSEEQREAELAAERNRRIAEEERMKRLQEQPQTIGPHVSPHVAPHAPTVHAMTEDPECEAHKKPESSEGSMVRAHAHTSQDLDCDAHTEPVSTEGESRDERLERLRRKKAEMDARIAYDSRYDEQDKRDREEARIREPEYEKTKLSFSENAVLQGIVYSEILKPPMCKRAGQR